MNQQTPESQTDRTEFLWWFIIAGFVTGGGIGWAIIAFSDCYTTGGCEAAEASMLILTIAGSVAGVVIGAVVGSLIDRLHRVQS